MVNVPFHGVHDSTGGEVPDTCVLEVRIAKPSLPSLFLTGNGEVYRRTIGGVKKLSGSELFIALANPLQSKTAQCGMPFLSTQLPTVYRRAELVAAVLQGQRVLFVDDHPSNNFYERVALAEMGLSVDVAVSTREGLRAAHHLRPNVIVTDMERSGQANAGLQFLQAARAQGIKVPVVFYVGKVLEALGVPTGAFAITDRPDELLHLVLDVLERNAI
jgi:CheY-like chemotaxis protein